MSLDLCCKLILSLFITYRSRAALSSKECEHWVSGLTLLCLETAGASSPIHLEWWLRREFFVIRPSGKENISLKELKDFLIRVNCKVPTNRLKELFQEITGGDLTRTELNFESFVAFYHSLTYDYQLFLK